MDKETLLYRYFSNELTIEQKSRFEELLRTDTDFKMEFEFEQNLKRAIKSQENGKLKNKLVGFEKEIILGKTSDLKEDIKVRDIVTNAPKTATPRWRNLSLAASVVLMIGLGWLGYRSFSATDYEGLYELNHQTYPNTVFAITRSDSRESLERDAFVAYEQGNYESAIPLFDQLSQDGDGEAYIDFFLGQSYLNLKRPKEAIRKFEQAIASDGEFTEEAYWYLALAYLKDGNSAEALKLLKILTEDYQFNQDKAEELIRDLE